MDLLSQTIPRAPKSSMGHTGQHLKAKLQSKGFSGPKMGIQ